MAKERLSKLQKWILLKLYEAGKDHYATPNYWRSRHYLVHNRIKEYLKLEKVKKYFSDHEKAWRKIQPSHYISEEEKQNWFKDKFEVSTTNSLKNLAKEGYVELLNKDRWSINLNSGYRQVTVFVQLKDKGVEAVEKLLTIK